MSRFPSGSRVFIGRVDLVKESPKALKSMFVPFGEIADFTPHERFAFVQYYTTDQADAAVKAMTGAVFGGRRMGTYTVGAVTRRLAMQSWSVATQ